MYFTQNNNNILVAGHRGNPSLAPENTMPSFESAIYAGVDMIEFDIQMTLDEKLIIMHDFTIDATTNGTGYVKNKTLKELRKLDAGIKFGSKFSGEKIPTLEELLELVKYHPNLLLNFEIKEYPTIGNEMRAWKTVDNVISLIELYKLEERCVINSFHFDVLSYIYKKYQGKYKLHGYFPKSLMYPSAFSQPYTILYCACVCENFTPDTFSSLKQMGIDTWVGPSFRDETTIELAYQCGATLITCDNPAEVLNILRKKGLHK